MADGSAIEWTDATWNPVRGCTRVSQGCRNCYAEGVAARFSDPGQAYHGFAERGRPGSKWTGEVRLITEKLTEPLRWRKPRKVFVNSMSDLFHESLDDGAIDRVFAVMAASPRHTFQVLTKRAARMRRYLGDPNTPNRIARALIDLWTERRIDAAALIGAGSWPVRSIGPLDDPDDVTLAAWPLPNVWVGVSVEDQATADERIPHLLAAPAAVRWISAEPLLGPVDLTAIPRTGGALGHTRPLDGRFNRLDWVVVGGESGPDARPMHPDWVRSLLAQCEAAGVPFFFKQWGEWHTRAYHMGTGEAVFRKFHSYQEWVNKAQTWVGPDGACLDAAGNRLRMGADFMAARDAGRFPVTIMHRVGKKAAGALLDGREHRAFPAPPAPEARAA